MTTEPNTTPGCSIRIRTATVDDAPDIVRVHHGAVHGTAAACYPPEILERWSRSPDERRHVNMRDALMRDDEQFIVAEVDGRIAGFGTIVPAASRLGAVYVHPEAGRRGVGGAILERIEQMATDRGLDYLEMDASLNAEAFYVRHGYETTGTGVFNLGDGIDMACLKMRKQLVVPGEAGEG